LCPFPVPSARRKGNENGKERERRCFWRTSGEGGAGIARLVRKGKEV